MSFYICHTNFKKKSILTHIPSGLKMYIINMIMFREMTQKSKTLNMGHRNVFMRKRVNVVLKNHPMWFY